MLRRCNGGGLPIQKTPVRRRINSINPAPGQGLQRDHGRNGPGSELAEVDLGDLCRPVNLRVQLFFVYWLTGQ